MNNINFRRPNHAATITLLALAAASSAALAETPAPNKGMDYLSVDTQADTQHNQQVLATGSVTVGRHAWVQAGLGKSRSDQTAERAGARHPGIATVGAGVASKHWQLAVNASQRSDGSRYRQTDVGSSLDWRNDVGRVGVDLTHRRASQSGTVAVDGSTVPAQARLSGNGVGLHGALQLSEHVSVYGALVRNHYESSIRPTDPATPGGPLGSLPVHGRALFGAPSVVNLDEVALDHSALVGATYRWAKVAVSGEYQAGQVHDGGGAMRSVNLKAAIDVAPGWRVAPGIGRGSSDQGGRATFASLSAMYGW